MKGKSLGDNVAEDGTGATAAVVNSECGVGMSSVSFAKLPILLLTLFTAGIEPLVISNAPSALVVILVVVLVLLSLVVSIAVRSGKRSASAEGIDGGDVRGSGNGFTAAAAEEAGGTGCVGSVPVGMPLLPTAKGTGKGTRLLPPRVAIFGKDSDIVGEEDEQGADETSVVTVVSIGSSLTKEEVVDVVVAAATSAAPCAEAVATASVSIGIGMDKGSSLSSCSGSTRFFSIPTFCSSLIMALLLSLLLSLLPRAIGVLR